MNFHECNIRERCLFCGGYVFNNLLGISLGGGLLGTILTATLGAVLLLFVIGIVKKA